VPWVWEADPTCASKTSTVLRRLPLPEHETSPKLQPWDRHKKPRAGVGVIGKSNFGEQALAESFENEVREWLASQPISSDEQALVIAVCFGGVTESRRLARAVGKGRTWVSKRLSQSLVRDAIRTIRAYVERGADLPSCMPDSPTKPSKALPLNQCAHTAREMLDPSKPENVKSQKWNWIISLPEGNSFLATHTPAEFLRGGFLHAPELVDAIRRCPALLLDKDCRPLLEGLVNLLEAAYFGECRRCVEGLLPVWHRPFTAPKRGGEAIDPALAKKATIDAHAEAEKMRVEARNVFGAIPASGPDAAPRTSGEASSHPSLPDAPDLPRQRVAVAAEKVLKELFKPDRGSPFRYPVRLLARIVNMFLARVIELQKECQEWRTTTGTPDGRLERFVKAHGAEFYEFTDTEVREILTKRNPLRLAARIAEKETLLNAKVFTKAWVKSFPLNQS
jgi:hypothetical protein